MVPTERRYPWAIAVYLPDAIGARAKAAELPLSRMLRDAVTSELERLDTMTKTLSDLKTFTLALENENGRAYTGRFQGAPIADNVYLLTDGRVLAYNENDASYAVLDDPESEVEHWVSGDALIDAMDALGLRAVVDL